MESRRDRRVLEDRTARAAKKACAEPQTSQPGSPLRLIGDVESRSHAAASIAGARSSGTVATRNPSRAPSRAWRRAALPISSRPRHGNSRRDRNPVPRRRLAFGEVRLVALERAGKRAYVIGTRALAP